MPLSTETIIGIAVGVPAMLIGFAAFILQFRPRSARSKRDDYGGAVSVPVAPSVNETIGTGLRIFFFTKHYGPVGVILCCLGSREVWQIQLQVARSTDDADAMNFKKSAQDDSNIIAVAGTIIAQIAITALSLDSLSQAHWIARAFFTFSLLSAIMAVYYATKQYRILGRCLRAEQVKTWIRGKNRRIATAPTRGPKKPSRHPDLPSTAAVLTVSAPNMLLSTSLNSLLVGFGVYLAFTWTRSLDKDAGIPGSRAVFITYIVGLVFCYGVYGLSGAVVANESYVSEHDQLYNEAVSISAAQDDGGTRKAWEVTAGGLGSLFQ